MKSKFHLPSGMAAILLFAAASPAAAISDHLQCFKAKDSIDAVKYTATLTPNDPAFTVMPGCEIRASARFLCVDTTKSNVDPAPPGSPDGDPAQTYLCYKVKCAKGDRTIVATDQFGVHSLRVTDAGLVCAPVTPPCTTAADCPGTDTDCSVRSCTAGVCGMTNLAAGTPGPDQQSGNCQKAVCDGSGALVSEADDTDVPVDGLSCTADICSSGSPSNPPAASGTACAENGGAVCDGSGNCVQCVTAGDCWTPPLCSTSTCLAGGTCSYGTLPNGSYCPGGTCLDGLCQ